MFSRTPGVYTRAARCQTICLMICMICQVIRLRIMCSWCIEFMCVCVYLYLRGKPNRQHSPAYTPSLSRNVENRYLHAHSNYVVCV